MQFQHRLDTAANWTSANPVLLAGELGLDTTNGRIKSGDGTTAWNSLAYLSTRILTGTAAPTTEGVDGDFYFRTTTTTIYGPKASGSWPGGVVLIGTNGWSPTFALVTNGSGGFVQQITGWTGGTGTPPSSTNQFIGSSGIVGTAAAAQDIRGPQGATGTPGTSPNAFLSVTGNTGTATADSSSDSLSIVGTGQASTTATDNPEVLTVAVPLLSGHVASVAGGVTTIGASVITNAMQVNMAANTMSGNHTGSAAAPADNALAANQFFARSSSSNITAQPITDAGLSWLNQASLANMTAALDVATTSAKGLVSAIDKKRLITLQYSLEADFGGVGDDSTLNDTAFSTAYSTMPVGSKLNIGAGNFRVAAAIDINVDKRIQHQGTGRYNTIIKTTSATAHIFTKSVAGWYDSWSDIGFQSTVTRTAGAAINIPVGNNIGMNVYRCWMTGMFHGINATGSQSANLSVWQDLDISAVANGGRGLVINGAVINVMITNVTINAGAATTSACVEINQSGAVQVTGCDWIQGTNVLLINSTAGAGPQACYFTNVFFDQPAGSVIKIVGTNTANRIKFTQCGIAPTGNNHAVEINGTGAGGVGTGTALPAGISLVDCDIYSANGTNTGAGVRINGCQDVNIQSCRITGFNGAGGAGVYVTPSASNQTKVRINGCIIGANSNLTVINETGVKLDAGASALGSLSITDNNMLGCGTAITDNSTILSTATKNISDNQGAAGGLFAQETSVGTSLTTTTETLVPGMQIYFPPNSIKVGTTLSWSRVDTLSATSTTIEKARIGTAGTVADATNISVTSAASGGAGSVFIEGVIAFLTVGAAGTFTGGIAFTQAAVAGGAPSPAVTGTVNTTVGNYISITTANGTANTRTFRGGSVQVASPA